MDLTERIYKLETDKNYKPGSGIIDKDQPGIKKLHCVRQPNNVITIRTQSEQTFSFPPEAFVSGAIYPYQIIQINKEGARCFVGLSSI